MQLELYPETVKETGPAVFEYFFLISPSSRIKEQIAEKKRLLHKEIGISKENLYSIAHVSLFKIQSPINDRFLSSLIKSVAENSKPFMLDIKEIEKFPHGNKSSIVLLFNEDLKVQRLREYLLFVLGSRVTSFTPHLTIAKALPNEEVQKIKELNDYFFEGSFECDKITILKKPFGSTQHYEIAAQIELKGQEESKLRIMS
jgi:2'-5' RNA ligase